MKKSISFIKENLLDVSLIVAISLFCLFLFVFKLGSLVPAYGPIEYKTANSILGFTGFFSHILYFPIEIIRSLIFGIIPNHGYTLTRFPNVIFGFMSVGIFAYITYVWHGRRTATLATLLFITSAWTLHVSRLASYDVLYTFSILSLVLVNVLLKKHKTSPRVLIFCGLLLGIVAFIPGMIWLILLSLLLLKDELSIAWQHLSKLTGKIIFTIVTTAWIPLVTFSIIEYGGLQKFIGLPQDFAGYWLTIKQFLAVPVHLFIRGPQYPELWLGKAPVFDIFVLILIGIGLYFYITHKDAGRSKMLLYLLIGSILLVGLGGAVSLSAPIAILFLISATGITFLLKEWLSMFPINPIARLLGIGLVVVAVAISATYGLRSYFVAWPNNTVTKQTFVYKK